ncbi:hypothetical protein DFP72DRAFT_1047939 [Ephemerocybe angulata]|uniref:Uncharacterized protein n=1 Tax=Ephemerocybe angulata TaxID=980116 RepID=A0A8H6HQ17_9AGAR|nr:hypothetical protein DFP72DRAFT_1047939 [Tulosesus angulatus]
MNLKALASLSCSMVAVLGAPQTGSTEPLTIQIQSELPPKTCGYIVLFATGGTTPYIFIIRDPLPPFAQVGPHVAGPTGANGIIWGGLAVPADTPVLFQVEDATGTVARSDTTEFVKGDSDECLQTADSRSSKTEAQYSEITVQS